MHPRARIAGITVIEQDGGLLVHDTERHVEHHLHPLTAFVWKHADGHRTVPEITSRVQAALGDDVTEAHVWAAIDVLTGARLLEGRVAPPAGVERFNRRDLLRHVAVGTVAAAAVGAVMVPDASASQKGNSAAARAQESASKVSAEHAQKVEKAAEVHQKKAAHDGAGHGGRRIVLAEGWTDAGGDFQGATFSETADVVVLGGLLQPQAGATSHVATLPRQARPAKALVFPCYAFSSSGDGVARVDVLADGRVFLVGGLGAMLYLSLAGVVFRSAKPRHGGSDPGEGASEQESKDAVAQEEASKAQEQDSKQAEQQAKQQAEQESKQQAEEQAKAAERENKQAAEQQFKQQAEQQNKQAAEQQAKQAAEQEAKQAAEQQSKQQAEQQAKSGG